MQSPELTSGNHCIKLWDETKVQLKPFQHCLNCAVQAVQTATKHFIAISVINSYINLTEFKQIPFSNDIFCEASNLNTYQYDNQDIKPTLERMINL